MTSLSRYYEITSKFARGNKSQVGVITGSLTSLSRHNELMMSLCHVRSPNNKSMSSLSRNKELMTSLSCNYEITTIFVIQVPNVRRAVPYVNR